MNSMSIRIATTEDAQFVYDVFADLRGGISVPKDEFLAQYATLLTTPNYLIFVAEVSGERAGVATLSRLPIARYAGWYYMFEEMAVDVRYRKTGVLFFLLSHIIEHCKADQSAIKLVGLYDGDTMQPIYKRYFTHADKAVIQQFLNPRSSLPRQDDISV